MPIDQILEDVQKLTSQDQQRLLDTLVTDQAAKLNIGTNTCSVAEADARGQEEAIARPRDEITSEQKIAINEHVAHSQELLSVAEYWRKRRLRLHLNFPAGDRRGKRGLMEPVPLSGRRAQLGGAFSASLMVQYEYDWTEAFLQPRNASNETGRVVVKARLGYALTERLAVGASAAYVGITNYNRQRRICRHPIGPHLERSLLMS